MNELCIPACLTSLNELPARIQKIAARFLLRGIYLDICIKNFPYDLFSEGWIKVAAEWG